MPIFLKLLKKRASCQFFNKKTYLFFFFCVIIEKELQSAAHCGRKPLFRRMSIGMDILDVVRALRHYCSTIWEYDRVTKKFSSIMTRFYLKRWENAFLWRSFPIDIRVATCLKAIFRPGTNISIKMHCSAVFRPIFQRRPLRCALFIPRPSRVGINA